MGKRPLCLAAVLFIVIQAVLVGGLRIAKDLRPSRLELAGEEGECVSLAGTVARREEKPKYQVYYLTDNQIRLKDQIIEESKILVYIKREESLNIQNQHIAVGNTIYLTGEVSFFQEATNPGNFDMKFYYQKQGSHASVWADTVKVTDPEVWRVREWLTVFRCRWKEVLNECLGSYYGNIMSGILLGDKSELDSDAKALYQKSGIGHILAISGLHLSFIGIGMYKLIRRMTGSYPVGGIFGILFLMLYILMIGFTVSAVRALTMFLFRVGADMAGRHYDAPTALSVSAVVVLLWRPLSLYDGGFWLSFGAVLAILMVVPVVQEGICTRTLHSNGQKMKKEAIVQEDLSVYALRSTDASYNGLVGVWEHVWQVILQGLTASFGINLVILPILLYYFFEFPLYSFVLNLFVIPLMSVLLFLGMAGSLLALWFAPVSALLFWICSKILWIYKISCEITLGLPGARLVIGRPDMWQIVLYYGIMLLGLLLLKYLILSVKTQEEQEGKGNQADWRNRRKQRKQGEGQSGSFNSNAVSIDQDRKKKQIAVFFLWAVGIMILTTRFGEAGKLTAAVLDVGQGDGIFMKGPEGGTYLVDGGSSNVKKVGQYRLEPFLKSQGVGKLDYVLISHGDSDHMNGVEELIEGQDIGVKIGTLVLPVKEVWDEDLKELAGKARNHGIRVVVIEPGQSIREGEMAITCIQPGNMEIKSEDTGSWQENAVPGTGSTGLEPGNAASMVLAVQYGEFDMLLTGDVEGEGEKQLTKQLEESYLNCTWEVLKVAHHGSKNSSTEEFLRQVQPAYALISAGQENRYGHPHQETVKRLADVGSRIYSTQENGAIIVEVEGGELLRLKKWQR